jgi:hypothetical protein
MNYQIKKVKEITFSNGDTSTLVYLQAVSESGFGKSEIIYTNFNGDTLPAINSIHELDSSRIQAVVGSDKKTRKWFI